MLLIHPGHVLRGCGLGGEVTQLHVGKKVGTGNDLLQVPGDVMRDYVGCIWITIRRGKSERNAWWTAGHIILNPAKQILQRKLLQNGRQILCRKTLFSGGKVFNIPDCDRAV